jgi:predicted dehydrogenase
VIHSPVRIAIVGCGLITANSHLPAALRSRGVELVGLVDTNPSRARALARSFAWNGEIADRLESVLPRVDGVVIATPNQTHAQLAEVALGAGVPVLIEKPLTTDYVSAIRLCELAERRHAFIATGFKTRHHPNVAAMKRLIMDGFFGTIHEFRYEFGSKGGWSPLSGYNLTKEQAGGGVLIVSGTHFLDRMIYWFGAPEIVAFEDDSYGGPEANCMARVRYAGASAFEGEIQLSKTARLRNQFTMETSLYHCEIPEASTDEIVIAAHARPTLEMRLACAKFLGLEPSRDYFQVQIENFAASIRTGKSPLVDGWFGAQSVKLVEDLYARRRQMPEPWMWYAESRSTAHA